MDPKKNFTQERNVRIANFAISNIHTILNKVVVPLNNNATKFNSENNVLRSLNFNENSKVL